MPRKPIIEGGKREEIAKAALELFLSKGYDGTSVRAIMNQAGGEVGLFYYYFKNKDDVFDKVLDLFFAHYDADFIRIVEHGRRNPCRVMQDFFEYMERETARFRELYADKMHRTMRWAIREHTLTLIEPYLEQIVEIQSTYYGVAPALEAPVAARYLTHGVGSYILHEDCENYWVHRGELKRGVSLLMGMPLDEQELRTPYQATEADVQGFMELLQSVKDDLPYTKEEAYEKELKACVACGEAWAYCDNEKIVAGLLFSGERKELLFLAVHPDFRHRGLGGRLVETMAAQFSVGTEITVGTLGIGNSLGGEARAFYKRLGFTEGKLEVTDTTPVA